MEIMSLKSARGSIVECPINMAACSVTVRWERERVCVCVLACVCVCTPRRYMLFVSTFPRLFISICEEKTSNNSMTSSNINGALRLWANKPYHASTSSSPSSSLSLTDCVWPLPFRGQTCDPQTVWTGRVLVPGLWNRWDKPLLTDRQHATYQQNILHQSTACAVFRLFESLIIIVSYIYYLIVFTVLYLLCKTYLATMNMCFDKWWAGTLRFPCLYWDKETKTDPIVSLSWKHIL